MFRYNFMPLEIHDSVLTIAIADPSQLQLTDELALLLGKRLQIKVADAIESACLQAGNRTFGTQNDFRSAARFGRAYHIDTSNCASRTPHRPRNGSGTAALSGCHSTKAAIARDSV